MKKKKGLYKFKGGNSSRRKGLAKKESNGPHRK